MIEQIAKDNLIFATHVGSHMYGLAIKHSDIDIVGIFVEPPELVMDLHPSVEQYTYRSAGEGNRSTADDIDATYYTLRKFFALMAKGDPNLAPLLYAPRDLWTQGLANFYSADLIQNRENFLSRYTGKRFSGYLNKHIDDVVHPKQRPELVEQFGYDTKAAYVALRIGLVGDELMRTGSLTLPLHRPYIELLSRIRRGDTSKEQALRLIEFQQQLLKSSTASSWLPERPDYAQLRTWCAQLHTHYWFAKKAMDRKAVIDL